MAEPKKHCMLVEMPKPLAKEYKKMVKERGMMLGGFTINLIKKAIEEWKKEDKNESTI